MTETRDPKTEAESPMATTLLPGAPAHSGLLLERAGELGALHAALDEAAAGYGQTVFVCGEAGIGKTSVIRAFLADAADTTMLVGRCDNLIAPRAFGPFRDMIRSSGLLPGELEAYPDRDSLLDALLDILGSALRPSIVVIEDAHWIDDASIDVVRYLLHRMPNLHGLLILSFRDDELAERHPLRAMVTGPSDRPPLRLAPEPLSSQAVATLAAGSGYEPERLMSVTGGNPFYLTEVLAVPPGDLPLSVRHTVTARAARLSDRGRLALQVLSVVPAGAAPALARALFADDPTALDEAEQSGLLEAGADRIRFRHELGRRTIEESLSFSQRLECNQRVLDALIATGADATTLVHVARAAGDADQATAFAMRMLRDEVAPTSHREIWTLARVALEHTARLSQAEIADLHLRAAAAGQAANHISDARIHAREAVRILREGGEKDPELVRALLTSAALSGTLGEHQQARLELEAARELLEAHPPGEQLAVCYSLMGGSAMMQGHYQEACTWSDLAIEVAEAGELHQPLVRALGNRGVARTSLGDMGGFDDLARARELAAEHGPVDRHATVVYNTAVTLLRWGRPKEAAPLIDEAERVCKDHGLGTVEFHARVQRALMLILRGEMVEAEALLDDLVSGEGSDPGAIRSTARALLGRIYTRRGDPRAEEVVEEAWRLAKATNEHQKIAVAGITKLEHAWLQRDDDGLRVLAADLLRLAEGSQHLRLRAEALRYLIRIGDPAAGCDDCPAGYREALSGNFRRAAEIWHEAGQPYEYALELVESTDPSVAFEGLRILDRLGATRTADLVRLRLRARGFQSVPRGPRKAGDGSVAILTDRQVEVVELIGDGLTNQEIADELFVARRTVDNHVSAILTRLGVESRHEAVDEAVARGLIEPR